MAIRAAAECSRLSTADLIETGMAATRGDLVVFETPVPTHGGMPWHEDWRFGQRWRPKYFASYDHYVPANRPEPYDVKFPWELNRLGFLPAVAQAAALTTNDEERAAAVIYVHELAREWREANPVAFSVNWAPMEASVRAVNLCATLELLWAADAEPEMTAGLLAIIAVHGEFIWRTREYTDVRGNHYAANVAALCVIGALLHREHRPARRWLRLGRRAIEVEVLQQLLPDGVQIERSLGYHTLVTALLLLGVTALEHAGLAVSTDVDARLHAACHYTADACRPDGLHPVVGDDDGAAVLSLASRAVPVHESLLAVAAARWNEASWVRPSATITALWLHGQRALEPRERVSATSQRRHYPDGGVVTVRDRGSHLWMDVGEVGLAGRGGHGHNDLGSFELSLQGQPVIVDPGSYMYSGDPASHDLFRSTAYHNVLMVDQAEMAPLTGHWRIDPVAAPINPLVKLDGEAVVVEVGHDGYRRLADPVSLRRRVEFSPALERLRCLDLVDCRYDHAVDRFLHFPVGWHVELQTEGALARGLDCTCELSWDDQSRPFLIETWRSRVYGRREPAVTLGLSTSVTYSTELWFAISATRAKGPG